MNSKYIEAIAASAKLGISLSDMSQEHKERCSVIIDVVKNFLNFIDKIRQDDDTVIFVPELALKYNIDKIILIPLPQKLCLVRVYGGDSKGFTQSVGIPFLEDLGINANSFDFLDDSYGIVIYDKTNN